MSLILSTAEDVQYAVKSNLSTAESYYQYNCRYAVWDELLEKREALLNFLLHQLKTARSLWWAVKISSLRKVKEISYFQP